MLKMPRYVASHLCRTRRRETGARCERARGVSDRRGVSKSATISSGAYLDEMRLPRAVRIEWRLPRHRHAVHRDRQRDKRLKGDVLDERNCHLPRPVVRAKAAERGGVVGGAARTAYGLRWRRLVQPLEPRRRRSRCHGSSACTRLERPSQELGRPVRKERLRDLGE